MRGAVAQPLQEAFRAAFQGTLVPAFESACQTMFSQVAPRSLSTIGRPCRHVVAAQAAGQLCCWTSMLDCWGPCAWELSNWELKGVQRG